MRRAHESSTTPRSWGRHAVALATATAVVTYLYGGLFDTHAFNSHEIFYEYVRAHEVAKELVSGHYPQVFGDALNGAGFAFPRFYPPLSLWLSAALALLVGNTVLGVNLAFFLSVLASAIAMYAGVWIVVRDERLALASTLVYVSLPYRFVDVFARGALAEAWTFAWYPLVVAGLWRAAAHRRVPWYLPLSVGALVLTHNITALYFLVFCAVFTALVWYWSTWRAALAPTLGVALGLALAAWFLIPQQFYLPTVWVSDPTYMWADIAHVQEHRVLPQQFFYSVPRLWYGESHEPGRLDGMSFELGAAQLLLVVAVLLFLRAWRDQRVHRAGRLVMLAWLMTAGWLGALAFMMLPGAFLQLLPSQFAYLQFPWRLLAFTALSSAFGMALFARAARLSSSGRWLFLAAGIAAVVFVPAFERTKWTKLDWQDDTLLSRYTLSENGGLGFTVLGEYLPRDFDVRAYRDGGVDPSWFVLPRVLHGEGAVTSFGRSGLDLDLDVESPDGCEVAFPLVAYDLYRVEDDAGRRLETSSDAGFLTARVPSGTTRLTVRRGMTRIVWIGICVSAGAALLTAWACVALRRRRKRP